MTKLKKFIWFLCLLLAFACLLIFISTSFELTTTLEGEIRRFSIGYGSPWYQQISGPADNSQQLNLLAPSFLAGIAGILIIWGWMMYDHFQ